MLIVKCAERLEQVRAEAKKLGIEDKLQAKLDYLANYACPDDDPEKVRCLLYTDFAPLSFGFTWETRKPDGEYAFWMAGGLIYRPDTQEWGVHT